MTQIAFPTRVQHCRGEMPVFRDNDQRAGFADLSITAITIPTVSIRRQISVLWDEYFNAGIVVFLKTPAAIPATLPMSGAGGIGVGRSFDAGADTALLSIAQFALPSVAKAFRLCILGQRFDCTFSHGYLWEEDQGDQDYQQFAYVASRAQDTGHLISFRLFKKNNRSPIRNTRHFQKCGLRYICVSKFLYFINGYGVFNANFNKVINKYTF